MIEARVERTERLGDAGIWIDLRVPDRFETPRAGQFVQIACHPEPVFRLNRPFSVCRYSPEGSGGILGILFSIVGPGSAWLAACRAGDPVRLLGPLGRGFEPVAEREPVLVGGGRGVAPMLFLADQLAPRQPDGLLLYGARDAASLFPVASSPYPVHVSTLDGSAGQRGTVLDLLDHLLRAGGLDAKRTALFACGPVGMLSAVSRLAERASIPVQVSVETIFGCGTGICAGCAIPLAADPAGDPFARYAFACTDGPVFDGARIDWPGVRE